MTDDQPSWRDSGDAPRHTHVPEWWLAQQQEEDEPHRLPAQPHQEPSGD